MEDFTSLIRCIKQISQTHPHTALSKQSKIETSHLKALWLRCLKWKPTSILLRSSWNEYSVAECLKRLLRKITAHLETDIQGLWDVRLWRIVSDSNYTGRHLTFVGVEPVMRISHTVATCGLLRISLYFFRTHLALFWFVTGIKTRSLLCCSRFSSFTT